MADDGILHTAEILKTMLPYVDVRTKTTMDLLVKFYELIGCFRNMKSKDVEACEYEKEQKVDLETMLNKIRPMVNQRERSLIDRLLSFFNMKRMMDMFNSYMAAMKAMQEFEGFGTGNADGEAADNFMNNLAGFDFSSIFGANSNKGDSSNSGSGFNFGSGMDFSSIFGSGRNSADTELHEDQDFHSTEDDSGSTAEAKADSVNSGNGQSSGEDSQPSQDNNGNNNMLNMLKNMVPPEQMSTFENLRMLFNNMSYDDNSKSDQNKEQ